MQGLLPIASMGREHGPFKKPASAQPTRHLHLCNFGGTPPDPAAVRLLLSQWDPAAEVTLPLGEQPKGHCYASLADVAAAAAARAALHGQPCGALGGRTLAVSFAEKREDAERGQQPVEPPLVAVRSAAECGIPGLASHPEFVSREEEAELLAWAEGQQHWQLLAKRRVLHFGHVFDYETRGVGEPLVPIPPEARRIADRIQPLPDTVAIDQLTVNEYPCGVGISPHVETHAAFTGAIASLSLGGPAVMVLRREGHPSRALFLPPRSLLVMSGESRYAWQHYVPHRKSDLVAAPDRSGQAEAVPRAERRVSFTFRQVRDAPCDCAYPEYCDSQLAPLAPTRMALKRMAMEQAQQAQQQAQQQQQEGACPAAVTCSAGGAGDGRQMLNGQGSNSAGGAGGVQSSALPGCCSMQRQQAEQQKAEQQKAEQKAEQKQQRQPPQREAAASEVKAAACPEAGEQAPAAAEGGMDGGRGNRTADAEADADLNRQLAALEQRYVHAVYDAIAPHFAATRFAVWPRVRAFLEALPAGAVLADVGCGNGKYFGVRPDVFVLGSDRSEGLARVAARRLAASPAGPQCLLADVAVADGLALPYRPASCDGALCIAVLHHIASPSRRLALLAQLLRILRPGGRALVTVWATEQENMKKVRSWQPIPIAAPQGASTAAAAAAAAAPPEALAGAARGPARGAAEGAAAASGSSGSGSGGAVMRTRGEEVQQGAAGVAAAGAAAGAGAAVASGDYFVPWHLPFHRAEAAAAARHARAGGKQPQVAAHQHQHQQPPMQHAAMEGRGRRSTATAAGCGSSGGGSGGGEPHAVKPVDPAPGPAPQVDPAKGAVVFQRYYHLFERGELDALVAQLPGAALVDSFYDKDNWCCVLERR